MISDKVDDHMNSAMCNCCNAPNPTFITGAVLYVLHRYNFTVVLLHSSKHLKIIYSRLTGVIAKDDSSVYHYETNAFYLCQS